ncbi:MAG: hypothetical protein QMD08_05040 [Actinomycetota bacterium]|nr:hypothetical protein [Actinomycetota bacterium]
MTDKKKSFKDLILWQKADLLYHNIADDVSKFPVLFQRTDIRDI